VKTAWLSEQKTLAWDNAYMEMRAKYTVLLPNPSENVRAVPVPSAHTTAAASELTSQGVQ